MGWLGFLQVTRICTRNLKIFKFYKSLRNVIVILHKEKEVMMRMLKKFLSLIIVCVLLMSMFTACSGQEVKEEEKKELIRLTWYQIGEKQKDADRVLEKVNAYIGEKIGVELTIRYVGWGDYNEKMQAVINTGDQWDLCFTSSWANDFMQNANKGVYLALDDLIRDTEMYQNIDPRFWEAATVKGNIYGVPSEKEITNMPMWVFTKEYVDKYNIPYETLHSLEDLEPWLQLIAEKEPDVVPLYATKDYSAPVYMDLIQDPVGIEYSDGSLAVKNIFETEKMQKTLKTMRKYYEAGYVNADAASASDDDSVKRFVTKGDGQPYAEVTWGKDLGYEVVTSPIMEASITNASAQGALTAVNAESKHPEKAVELLNLINTDLYLRNLLNYGIEGEHWEKVEAPEEELQAAKGKPYVYEYRVRLTEKSSEYSVPYWVQGGLFNTYVLENEPVDKWATFKQFNDTASEAASFGFDFDLEPVSAQVSAFRSILDEYGKALYTGSVDPDKYLPQLLKKLKGAGVEEVEKEMERQAALWKKEK